jgi:hypothetical protein
MGNATAASLDSSAGKKSSAGIHVRPVHSETIQQTAASAKQVARRSNRAEIQMTASLLGACRANREAARGPTSDRGASARPMSNTSTALAAWISRFVR